jgi:hypothetical protein
VQDGVRHALMRRDDAVTKLYEFDAIQTNALAKIENKSSDDGNSIQIILLLC